MVNVWHQQPTDASRSMGRPPLGNKATTVRLSEETLQRIDSYVGVKQRAVFIREAIEARLKYMDSLKKFMTDKE